MVSNEKIAQSDAFAKDWNDADEKGIDVGGHTLALKPSFYTDFILKTKLIQLLPST